MLLCLAVTIGFRDTKHISNAAGKRVFLFFEDPTNQQMFLFLARIERESYLSLGNESLIEAERNRQVQNEPFATLSIILVTVVCSLGLPDITPSLAVRILIMAPLGINLLILSRSFDLHLLCD
ncbi:hypothetical protein Hanom_Chr02g00124831 [Helianthus anomalus]